MKKLPKFVAHRGYPRHYPENTMVGLEAAVAAGAEFVEIDIQLSRDGRPFLFHDSSLWRVCGKKGSVFELSLSELAVLNAGEPGRFGDQFCKERIPSLKQFADFLQKYPHVTAFIELKEESLTLFGQEKVVEAVIAELGHVAEQCVLISFSYEAVLRLKQKGWTRTGVVLFHWKDLELDIIKETDPDFVFCNVNRLPQDGSLSTCSSRLVVYEIDDPIVAALLHERGAEFVETFAIGDMLRASGFRPENE